MAESTITEGGTEAAAAPAAAKSTKRWYVVHAYSGMEKSVKKALLERIARSGMENQFGEILVPISLLRTAADADGDRPDVVLAQDLREIARTESLPVAPIAPGGLLTGIEARADVDRERAAGGICLDLVPAGAGNGRGLVDGVDAFFCHDCGFPKRAFIVGVPSGCK